LPSVPFEKSYFVGLKPAVVLRSQFLQWSSTFLQDFCTVLFCTVQYGKVQYSTVWYSTVQYGKVLYSTVPYSTVHYSILQYSTSKYSTVYGCLITVAGWPDLDLNFRSAPNEPNLLKNDLSLKNIDIPAIWGAPVNIPLEWFVHRFGDTNMFVFLYWFVERAIKQSNNVSSQFFLLKKTYFPPTLIILHCYPDNLDNFTNTYNILFTYKYFVCICSISIVRDCLSLYSTVQYSMLLFSTIQYCTLLYKI